MTDFLKHVRPRTDIDEDVPVLGSLGTPNAAARCSACNQNHEAAYEAPVVRAN